MKKADSKSLDKLTGAIVLFSIFLSAVTLSFHLRYLGISYLETIQLGRHQDVIEGIATAPWQYRILSEYILELFLKFFRWTGGDYPASSAFLTFRLLLGTFLFCLAGMYYRLLGLSRFAVLTGMICGAWSISLSYFDSDLSFNTFADVIFYLLAAFCILKGEKWILVPIVFLACANRETSLFIPFMVIVGRTTLLGKPRLDKEEIIFLLLLLASYATAYVGIRFWYGYHEVKGSNNLLPGLDMFLNNLTEERAYVELWKTLAIFPLWAFFGRKYSPPVLRNWFDLMLLPWFFVHFFMARVAETRLFFVPLIVLIVPVVLFGLDGRKEKTVSLNG